MHPDRLQPLCRARDTERLQRCPRIVQGSLRLSAEAGNFAAALQALRQCRAVQLGGRTQLHERSLEEGLRQGERSVVALQSRKLALDLRLQRHVGRVTRVDPGALKQRLGLLHVIRLQEQDPENQAQVRPLRRVASDLLFQHRLGAREQV